MTVKNEWTSTLEALRDSNKAKDAMIADLFGDIAELRERIATRDRLIERFFGRYGKNIEFGK